MNLSGGQIKTILICEDSSYLVPSINSLGSVIDHWLFEKRILRALNLALGVVTYETKGNCQMCRTMREYLRTRIF